MAECGTPTSRASVKPEVTLFVSTCFNQILKMLYCLKMKGSLVGVVFPSLLFCPTRSMNSLGA